MEHINAFQDQVTSLVDEIHGFSLETNATKRIQKIQELQKLVDSISTLNEMTIQVFESEKKTVSDYAESKKQQAIAMANFLQTGNIEEYTPVPEAPAFVITTKSTVSKKGPDSSWSQVVKGKRSHIQTPKETVIKSRSNDYVGAALIQTPQKLDTSGSVEIFEGFSVPVVWINKPEQCLKHPGHLCKISGPHTLKGFYIGINNIVIPMNMLKMLTVKESPFKFIEYNPAYPDHGNFYKPPEVFPGSNDERVLTSRTEYIPSFQDPYKKSLYVRIGDRDNFEEDLRNLNNEDARRSSDIASHEMILGYLIREYKSQNRD